MAGVGELRDFLVIQRREVGWTQEELAELSGVSVRTIRNLESGSINNPRRASIELVLKALDVTISPLLLMGTNGGASGPAPRVTDLLAREAGWPEHDGTSERRTWHGRRPDAEPMIGRDCDLRHVIETVKSHRLVILTGPGGVGKTRLALAAADHVGALYRDGVAVAELGTLIPERVNAVQAFGNVRDAVLPMIDPLGPGAGQTDNGQPAAAPRMLVVIDNAEHVVESVTRLAQQLLARHVGLHLIVTARRPLPLTSARVWEVNPLGTDTSGGVGARPAAVELFLRRAHASCPTLNLGDRLPAVAELCRRLEGLPLAIELAAHRIRAVSLDTLLRDERISQLIGHVSVGGLPHQRTLPGSVLWSYDMLTEEQRALLHHVARFGGPFTIEDVEGLRPVGAAYATNISLLAELVDASLVQVSRYPQYTYRILAFVREYVNMLRDDPGATRESRRLAARTGCLVP